MNIKTYKSKPKSTIESIGNTTPLKATSLMHNKLDEKQTKHDGLV
jgi:hypothetical protein